MEMYGLILGVLAVWRVTHFFQAEDGPWKVVVRVRQAMGNGEFGRFLDCFYCFSIWVAVPIGWWIGSDWKERILLVLSCSGGAILLDRWTGQIPTPHPTMFYEDKEDDHGLLWNAENANVRDATSPRAESGTHALPSRDRA
jgi:hypothetical protein